MDTKQAELEISQIKKIMEETRSILVDDGLGFIVWGLLISCGLLLTYFSVLGFTPWTLSNIAWFVLIGAGWVFTIIQVRKDRKQMKAVTFAGKVAGAIWGSAGITMTIIGFVGSYSGMIKGYGICPLMACVLGSAFFVSGVIHNQRMFRLLGFGWWAGAIIMFFWISPHTLLMFAIMMLMMQVLPGVLMYSKWKKEMKAA